MLWFILMPLNLLISIFCYITNPIVCLFANEVGDLPKLFRLWQTWDDSCDVDWFVKETVPAIFRYDFDSKYISSRQETPELSIYNRDRGCVILREGATFSIKERIQRYFCRVLWLTRNCAYGFAFFWFGRFIAGQNCEWKTTDDSKFGVSRQGNIFTKTWQLYSDAYIGKCFGVDIYWKVNLGWKIDAESYQPKMAMMANRVAFTLKSSK